ncbi:ADP-ribosylglycohydrolase family protein [Thermoflavimicrobium dichotomicum]|uniref:ADP-ribosylglycohydrolase n=1 Tax=Thermoflavimicrobium dichotomicum TaxID=46223 RepID=A0A1I3RY68_9BACL|nr:ADP-ribosylglycohydrolase family protein [Thermoflavimicrobium dichotomicum]SFJ50241.1 ADP-ribosylglycohydrolase [Thermoflavimicrobium dichotomicum]
MISREERIRGGFWGLLIGDALGVPYEFTAAHDIPPLEEIDFEPPTGFNKAYPYVPAGTWSDDGAQALALLDSLLTCRKLDLDDFAKRLLAWYERGEYAVDYHVFDVGIQTGEALNAVRSGTAPTQSGWVRPEGKGNGALMRVLPLALWHRGTDEELVEDAHRQSLVTHAHPTNQVCCALYCVWARRLLSGMDVNAGYLDAVRTLREIYPQGSVYSAELEWTIRPEDGPVADGSGYVVDSLRAALLTLQQPDYEQVVKSAVAIGRDTDTNAAIAGGLAGIRDGVSMIPEKWLRDLRGKEIAEPLLTKLLMVAL